MKNTIIIFCLFVSILNGYEKQTACLQYENKGYWSKKYKITGLVYSGSELYGILPYHNIDILKYYFVVFWNNNEASIIKINNLYTGGEILYNMNGIDQNGIEWKLSSQYFCY